MLFSAQNRSCSLREKLIKIFNKTLYHHVVPFVKVNCARNNFFFEKNSDKIHTDAINAVCLYLDDGWMKKPRKKLSFPYGSNDRWRQYQQQRIPAYKQQLGKLQLQNENHEEASTPKKTHQQQINWLEFSDFFPSFAHLLSSRRCQCCFHSAFKFRKSDLFVIVVVCRLSRILSSVYRVRKIDFITEIYSCFVTLHSMHIYSKNKSEQNSRDEWEELRK